MEWGNVLEPVSNGVKLGHRDSRHRGNLLLVVFEHKHHVKIPHVELVDGRNTVTCTR